MKSRLLPCIAATLAFSCAASLAHATVWFHNTGTLSGWDGSNLDSNCSLTESTSVVYKGSTSVKATGRR